MSHIYGEFSAMPEGDPPHSCNSLGSNQRGPLFVSGPHGVDVKPIHIPEGTVLLERFHVLRFLGYGRLGSTFLCEDLLARLRVALKIAPKTVGNQAEQSLLQEVRMRERITDFRYVLAAMGLVEGSWNGDNFLAVVLRYAEGGTLHNWIEQHRLDLARRCSMGLEMMRQGIEGVAALWKAGIMPLDVKPDNFFLVNGIVQIGDLAGAVVRNDRSAWLGCASKQTPRNLGTDVYMPPEQFTATSPSELSEASIVYSIGVVLYEMLHPRCELPFGENPAVLRERHRPISPEPLPEVQKGLAALVMSCMEWEPSRRPGSLRDVLNALETFTRSGEPGVPEMARASPCGVPNIETAQRLFESGQLPAAAKACREILDFDKPNAAAAELLEDIERRDQEVRAIYERVAAGFEVLSLRELGVLLQEAEEIYPVHPAGSAYRPAFLARCAEYKEVIEEFRVAFKSSTPNAALSYLKRAAMLNPNDPAVGYFINLIEEIGEYRACSERTIDAAMQRGDIQTAQWHAQLLEGYLKDILPGPLQAD